jgi:ABC-type multidrug transport system permease subunit
LEGSPQWVQQLALIFPLTHILKAARRVMSDGGGIIAVQSELLILSAMTVLFLSIGAYLFSWNE